MISIVICSVNKTLLDNIEANISTTIGVKFEIISINNTIEKLSICAAYNKGAAKAKFNYILFLHEDVFFKTNNWGEKLVSHFNMDTSIGLIGIAGGVYKSKMVAGWWQSEPNNEFRRMNIIQRNNLQATTNKHITINPNSEQVTNVVTLDGVFLATTKTVWLQNKFDENLLKKFHGYDLDFSLQIAQKNRVVVIYDILIEHFSGGKANTEWLQELLIVHKKWKAKLPFYTKEIINSPILNTIEIDDLKRLRKNIQIFFEDKKGLIQIIVFFTKCYTFIDKKKNANYFVNYLKEISKIFQLYLRKK